MRVLIINTSESRGGAAVAASRLTDALNHQGIEARMLVRDDKALRQRWAFLWERARVWMANGLTRRGLWAVDLGVGGADITSTAEFREADVVHLHWVNQGFLSLEELGRILRSGKPVVWTLHDMWPLTGICHHAGTCDRYGDHCHDCPLLVKGAPHDLSWQVFRQKRAVYGQGAMTFVAVSRWMAERARTSALAEGHDVVIIPNTLPLERFVQQPRQQARRQLGLDAKGRKIVAFGAARIDQPGKGFERLLQAVEGVDVHLLLFGSLKDRTLLSRVSVPFTYVGPVEGPEALSTLYSAADVLVSASDYESFGQTLIEAMACGCTPVSFDRGGQTDIIHHLEDGYLARACDVEDLRQGILWALQTPPDPATLHRSVAARFSEEVVVRQHIRLYEQLLGERKS